MAYLTETMLRQKAIKYYSLTKSAAGTPSVTIFLSHSHKDKDLVKGLITVFAEEGVAVYVDWNDASMPRVTSRETAERIKQRIGEMSLFAILATHNGLSSRWVPWETGVADQKKPVSCIFVIPVPDNTGQYPGSEYLQLYQRFEMDSSGVGRIAAPGEELWEGRAASSFLRQHVVYG